MIIDVFCQTRWLQIVQPNLAQVMQTGPCGTQVVVSWLRHQNPAILAVQLARVRHRRFHDFGVVVAECLLSRFSVAESGYTDSMQLPCTDDWFCWGFSLIHPKTTGTRSFESNLLACRWEQGRQKRKKRPRSLASYSMLVGHGLGMVRYPNFFWTHPIE